MSGGFGNPGPPGDTGAAADLDALAAAVAPDGTPEPGQPVLAVATVNTSPMFTAAPEEGEMLPATYVAGTAPFKTDRLGHPYATFVEVYSADIATGVETLTGQLPEELAPSGGLKADVVGSVLPAGAATETTLGTRASESTLSTLNSKIPASPAQDRTTAAAPNAVRLSDGATFYKGAVAGDNMGADLRVGGAAVSATNPVLTRPDPTGRTLAGDTRVAGRSTLSSGRHNPAAMVSLGGLTARHRQFDLESVGGGVATWRPTTQSLRLSVPAVAGARMTARQRIWNPYRPGSPTRAQFNWVADTQRAGNVYRAGPFDDSDGLFLERDDSGTYFVTRSFTSGAVVDTRVPLVGVDLAKANLCEIAYEWFGAGKRALFVNGAQFSELIGGGVSTVPYMRRPNLPMTFQIENVSGANASYLDFTCWEVDTEGDNDITRAPGTYFTTTTSIPTAGNGGKMLLQVRPAAQIVVGTHPPQEDRGVYIPTSVKCFTQFGPLGIRVVDNGVTGGTPSWNPSSLDPGLEIDVAGTFNGATGDVADVDSIEGTSGSVELDLRPYYQFPGRALSAGAFSGADTLIVWAFSRTGTVASVDTLLRWERIG